MITCGRSRSASSPNPGLATSSTSPQTSPALIGSQIRTPAFPKPQPPNPLIQKSTQLCPNTPNEKARFSDCNSALHITTQTLYATFSTYLPRTANDGIPMMPECLEQSFIASILRPHQIHTQVKPAIHISSNPLSSTHLPHPNYQLPNTSNKQTLIATKGKLYIPKLHGSHYFIIMPEFG
jgi:hypothetical protein